MKLKIAIFEDNANRRNGLELLINSTEDLECVGAYEDCSAVIDHIMDCSPDVVLMDINMPNVNGIKGLKLIKEYKPNIKVLMQTIFEEDDQIFAAVCAGADGYILKKTPPSKLIDAIIEVMHGGAPMTPTVARQVLRLINQQNKKNVIPDFNLSTREMEILGLLVQGLSYKMIAERCSISYSTVNTHIKHIYEKLQVHSVVEAVTKAIDQKIV